MHYIYVSLLQTVKLINFHAILKAKVLLNIIFVLDAMKENLKAILIYFGNNFVATG